MSASDRVSSIVKVLAAAAVLLGVWLAYELMNDPFAQMRTALLAERPGEASDDPGGTELPAELDYEGIQQVISGSRRLWGPLVQKPKPPPRKPNLEAMIKGLQVVTVLSENNELRCIIKDKNTHTVCKKGDKIRELTIDSVTPTQIVLSYQGATIKLSL